MYRTYSRTLSRSKIPRYQMPIFVGHIGVRGTSVNLTMPRQVKDGETRTIAVKNVRGIRLKSRVFFSIRFYTLAPWQISLSNKIPELCRFGSRFQHVILATSWIYLEYGANFILLNRTSFWCWIMIGVRILVTIIAECDKTGASFTCSRQRLVVRQCFHSPRNFLILRKFDENKFDFRDHSQS